MAASMRTFRDIHRCPVQNAYSPSKLKYQHQVENPNARSMPIPLILLEVADQYNDTVVAYRTEHYPVMGPLRTEDPYPSSKARGEQSKQVRVQHNRVEAALLSTRNELFLSTGEETVAMMVMMIILQGLLHIHLSQCEKPDSRHKSQGISHTDWYCCVLCRSGPSRGHPNHVRTQTSPLGGISTCCRFIFTWDISHTLPEVRSEPHGIETSLPLPQPTTSLSARVLEPLDDDPFLDLSLIGHYPLP